VTASYTRLIPICLVFILTSTARGIALGVPPSVCPNRPWHQQAQLNHRCSNPASATRNTLILPIPFVKNTRPSYHNTHIHRTSNHCLQIHIKGRRTTCSLNMYNRFMRLTSQHRSLPSYQRRCPLPQTRPLRSSNWTKTSSLHVSWCSLRLKR
jgi:hypothetical protein